MSTYAWLMSFIRLPLLFLFAVFVYFFLSFLHIETNFPYSADLSTIYFTIVNAICLYVLFLISKKGKMSLKELVGYDRTRFIKDMLFAFLWLFVLYIPFSLTILGTMFLMYGADFPHQFEAVFAGDTSGGIARPSWLIWTGAIFALFFPFLNAPVEELMYRGFAQRVFIRSYTKVWLGILIPSIGFALQHVVLATSIPAAVVYMAAFFVWGVGSGIIYYKQQRLFPLILCHFIVNFSFSILPIVLLLTGVYS